MARGGGDEGQMMLLAAVLLVIGFVALGAVYARVDLAASRTGQVQESPLMLEVGQLAQAVDAIIVAMDDNHTAPSPAFYENLTTTLDQVAALETARGLPMRYALVCDAGTGRVEVAIMSPDTRVTFLSSQGHAC